MNKNNDTLANDRNEKDLEMFDNPKEHKYTSNLNEQMEIELDDNSDYNPDVDSIEHGNDYVLKNGELEYSNDKIPEIDGNELTTEGQEQKETHSEQQNFQGHIIDTSDVFRYPENSPLHIQKSDKSIKVTDWNDNTKPNNPLHNSISQSNETKFNNEDTNQYNNNDEYEKESSTENYSDVLHESGNINGKQSTNEEQEECVHPEHETDPQHTGDFEDNNQYPNDNQNEEFTENNDHDEHQYTDGNQNEEFTENYHHDEEDNQYTKGIQNEELENVYVKYDVEAHQDINQYTNDNEHQEFKNYDETHEEHQDTDQYTNDNEHEGFAEDNYNEIHGEEHQDNDQYNDDNEHEDFEENTFDKTHGEEREDNNQYTNDKEHEGFSENNYNETREEEPQDNNQYSCDNEHEGISENIFDESHHYDEPRKQDKEEHKIQFANDNVKAEFTEDNHFETEHYEEEHNENNQYTNDSQNEGSTGNHNDHPYERHENDNDDEHYNQENDNDDPPVFNFPIIVHTEDEAYHLFPLKSNDEQSDSNNNNNISGVLFETTDISDRSLEELFSQIRSVFESNETPFDMNEELVLEISSLTLSISEDNVYSRDITLNDIITLFLGLKDNSSEEDSPKELSILLYSQQRFIGRFNNLTNIVKEGKGFIDLETTDDSYHDNTEYPSQNNDYDGDSMAVDENTGLNENHVDGKGTSQHDNITNDDANLQYQGYMKDEDMEQVIEIEEAEAEDEVEANDKDEIEHEQPKVEDVEAGDKELTENVDNTQTENEIDEISNEQEVSDSHDNEYELYDQYNNDLYEDQQQGDFADDYNYYTIDTKNIQHDIYDSDSETVSLNAESEKADNNVDNPVGNEVEDINVEVKYNSGNQTPTQDTSKINKNTPITNISPVKNKLLEVKDYTYDLSDSEDILETIPTRDLSSEPSMKRSLIDDEIHVSPKRLKSEHKLHQQG